MAVVDRADRIRGALLGLLAGDKIGGPSRMALELAESLVELERFDPADVVRRYKAWYDREGFDTGRVADLVFRKMDAMPNRQAVKQVDVELGGLTAGCNPAHRALPQALVPFIEDGQLGQVAREEATLTHAHPAAGNVSAGYLQLVRQLVSGRIEYARIAEAIGQALRDLGLPEKTQPSMLANGGHAPEVFQAAMHFIGIAKNFDEALDSAIGFAGPQNYCPVLVGALAGAHWGVEVIQARHLSHVSSALLGRADHLGVELAEIWN